MQIQTYLFFDGCCEEAINFYCNALDAKVDFMMRFSDGPPDQCPPGAENKIMHATLIIGESAVMASDGPSENNPEFKGFSLSISTDDEQEAKDKFAALAEEGEITMPLEPTFWAPLFGMVTDKFGMSWMVNLNGEP